MTRRRVDANAFGRDAGAVVSLLRAPGIYAADRLPMDRLRAGTPALAGMSSPTTSMPTTWRRPAGRPVPGAGQPGLAWWLTP